MEFEFTIEQIVSGGQTGVDQGALDAALWLGIPHGGWCPRGRRCEDGAIPATYQLVETQACDYSVRTEKNVIDSDGTLILYRDALTGGTAHTVRMAKKHNRPLYCVDLATPTFVDVSTWLVSERIHKLNVAGPRESSCPGISEEARLFIVEWLRDGANIK